MKLVDILAREFSEWPEGAAIAVQDRDGEIKFGESEVVKLCHGGHTWLREGQKEFEYKTCRVADDRGSSIVTRAEWQAAVGVLKAVQADEPKWPDGAEFMGTGNCAGFDSFYKNITDDSFEVFCSDMIWRKVVGTPAYTPLIPRPAETELDKSAPKVIEWAKGSLPPIGSVVEWDGCTFAPEEPQEKDLRVGDQVTIIAHLKDGDFEMAAFTFSPKIHNPARGSIWVNQGAYGCFRPIRTAEQVAAEERMAAAYGMCAIAPSLSNVDAIALYDASYRKQVLK